MRGTFDSLLLANVVPALEAVSVGLGFDPAGKVSTVSAAAQVLNADPSGASLGGNDSMQVDLRRFEVYAASSPPPVPALAPWAAALLAGVLLLLVMIRPARSA